MKVNLSYSVELDEVMTSVASLYKDAKEKFEQNYNALTVGNAPKFSLSKLEATLRNFTATHQVMSEFANRIEELQGIMVGYREVLKQKATPDGGAPAPVAAPPTADEDNE
tara:strand:- start:888 stop:1217 length:330 start_codon:yes stop_codon:yes gene_type:complete